MAMPTDGETKADRIAALMQKAAAANVITTGRRGLLLELPPEDEVMISGDLHGNVGNLRRLSRLARLRENPRRHLIVHEAVHDVRGEEVDTSYRAIEMCAQLKTIFTDRFHYLLGNHEFSELLGLDIGKRGRPLNAAFADGLQEVYGSRWQVVLEAYRRFWRTCPLAIRTPNRLFISHTTPHMSKIGELDLDLLRTARPDDVLRRDGPAFSMLWGRDYRRETADAFAERMDADILIVGHTPCDQGVDAPSHRHIVLDCTTLDGRYVLLPLDRPLTQADILAKVTRLFP